MKPLLFFLSVLCLLSACKGPEAELTVDKEFLKKQIGAFYRSFGEKNMELMSDLMAHDESMLSFGTGKSDIHHSWAEWKENHLKQFEAFDRASIQSKNLQVYTSSSATVAWFADVTNWSLQIQHDTIRISDVRITGVLERRDTAWKIVQIHASLPAE